MNIFMIVAAMAGVAAVFYLWKRIKWQYYKKHLAGAVMDKTETENKFVDLTEVEQLPEPVKRYFHFVLKQGQPIIRKATIRQHGGFRIKPQTVHWSGMNAIQYFSTTPRAYLWDAAIAMMPRLVVNVCDAYIYGQGRMKAKMLSVYTVVDVQGEEQLNSGALMRYLAETVWFPTALLPSQGVKWEVIDHHKANATLSDAGTTVSLEFEFNDKGEVVSIYSAGRYREVNGNYELTGWKGRFSNYIKVDDNAIPSQAEVEWHLADQPYPYWKAELVDIQYQY